MNKNGKTPDQTRTDQAVRHAAKRLEDADAQSAPLELLAIVIAAGVCVGLFAAGVLLWQSWFS